MAKITHTSLMFTDLRELDEIPSDFIEPYLVKFWEYIIESVGCGWKTPAEAKGELKGIENFVSLFGGLHSRIATMNEYYKVKNMNDDQFLDMCKRVCK